MNVEDLRSKQADFEGNRQELRKRFSELEKLRKVFISKFSPKKLLDLSIEEYVVGKENSFCYWLETKLMDLGKIKGGSPADKKFGIYFGKTKNETLKKYRFLKKFGSIESEAYFNIKSEIIDLIQAGAKDDINKIICNRLSPMFKGKILSTYYPNKYLNIFAKEHLDYFLEKLDLVSEDTKKVTEVEKRNLLMQFKNSDSVMKDWSIYEFTKFLYNQFGRPAREDKIPKELKEFIVKYPPLNKVRADFVDLSIDEIMETKDTSSQFTRRKKIDFEKENKRNRKLGKRGELIVLKKEKEYLESIGRRDLCNRIKHVSMSEEDDSAGYDILSFDDKGNEKCIEVKSTKSKVASANFIISSNEFNKAKGKENYFIYIVFEANSLNPKIFKLRKPFDLPGNKIRIIPERYRVFLNLGRLIEFSLTVASGATPDAS